MASPIKSLFMVGVFGVGGLVGALGVIGLTRIAESFWFRPLARRRVITNGQQDCTDRPVTGDLEGAPPTPATGSDFSPGDAPKSTENFTIQMEKIAQLKASLDEIGQLLQDKIALELEVARLNRLLEERMRVLSAEGGVAHLNRDNGHSSKESTRTGDRKPGNGHRTTRDKDSHTSTEQLHKPAPPLEGKPDIISVADVAESVRMLNARILQACSLIADSLSYRESPISSKEMEDLLNELTGYIGPRLCTDLRRKAQESKMEPDPLITQIALQSGLVNACSHIINNGIPPTNGATLSLRHSDMVEAVSDAHLRTPPPHPTTSQSERKYVAGIALKLIAAVGGSMESGGALPPQYRKVVDEIVKGSLELHKAVSEDAASIMELVTYTIPCDTDFDPSTMEDTEGGGTQDTVICALEMGLRCRKRRESGSREEWAVAVKSKVVLASTLEV
ncbi:hypothetical protein M378DRAFT_28511 [Amanita muscaria Koide BX008]|uniref:Uncharacterized protein n=1 Tax=Amanita muscaria (strain Koide BX008) TaxID=946122 RepID=A0A0C2WGH3_AMAMK|nr:hypothetical protein M378DRAFT_28511 [Amanita muscaria Koide BX008]